MQKMTSRHCFCGLSTTYEVCCARFHTGVEYASTAELLMRSRYSAYVLVREDYLLKTWHVDTRPATLNFLDAGKTKWLGLDIKRHTMIDVTHAEVEFVARYKIAGQSAVRLHEISDFVLEDGRWFYVFGVFLR